MSAVEDVSGQVAQALTFGEDARIRFAENVETRGKMLELIGSLAAAIADGPAAMQEVKDRYVRSRAVATEAIGILGISAEQLEGLADEHSGGSRALRDAAEHTRQAEDYGMSITPDQMYDALDEEIKGATNEFWGLIHRVAKLKATVEVIGRYEGNGALNSIAMAREAGVRYTHQIGAPIGPLPGTEDREG